VAKTTTATPQDSGGRRAIPRPRLGGSGSGKGPGGDAPLRRSNAPNLASFFQESRAELRKVTWPSRQEATNLTVAVIGMTLAISVFLGVIDAGLDKLVSILLGTG
jgi:preprotein translocase subunit SecE